MTPMKSKAPSIQERKTSNIDSNLSRSDSDSNTSYNSTYIRDRPRELTVLKSISSTSVLDTENIEYRRKILSLESAVRQANEEVIRLRDQEKFNKQQMASHEMQIEEFQKKMKSQNKLVEQMRKKQTEEQERNAEKNCSCNLI